MTKEELFESWAPSTSIWSPWAKPVLFSHMNNIAVPALAPAEPIIDLAWAIDPKRATAIVADLPGAVGVVTGLALAAIGYRPVPLYNACPALLGDAQIIDTGSILLALAENAASIKSYAIPDDAPPVFLLDALRNPVGAPRTPGLFDNRSISLPTDFPSANLLLSHGIQQVVLIDVLQRPPQADLSHTLLRWQEAGLPIFVKTPADSGPPRPITIQRPNKFRLLWYNLLARAGLIRNPLGGFGGKLPMQSSAMG
jgi:hypothetical protein